MYGELHVQRQRSTISTKNTAGLGVGGSRTSELVLHLPLVSPTSQTVDHLPLVSPTSQLVDY